MKFGKAIRVIRATRNISQKKLSELTNLDFSYISRIESEDRIPSTETLKNIADALSVPVYLLVLLASDKSDLKKKHCETINKISKDLLNLVINS